MPETTDGRVAAAGIAAEPHDSAGLLARMHRHSTRALVPIALFIVALGFAVAFFSEAWGDPTTTWKGDLGDPEQFQLFLAWTPYALGHGLDPFVTHAVLYPGGANLMWNTAVFLPALLVSPVTVLFGPTVAYDVLMLLAPPVTAVAGYAAFRRYAGRAGAATGGLLFAICPFFVAHAAGHLHLMLLALVPAMLLVLDELVVRQRWRWQVTGVLLGVVAAAQLLTAEEVLALDVLVAAIGIVLLAVTHPRSILPRLRYALAASATALVVFAALAAYPLVVQFFGPDRVEHTIHATDWYVNDLLGVIAPAGQLVGWQWAHDVSRSWTGGPAEWNGYLGIPFLAVVLVMLAVRRRPAVWFCAAMAALTLVLSFGSRLHVDGRSSWLPLPWTVVAKAPLLHQVLPARFGLYVGLFAAALMAIAVDAVARSQRPVVSFAGGIAVGAVLVSWLPHGWSTTTVEQPAYFTTGGGVHRIPSGSVAVVLPLVAGPNTEHAELWQARAGFPFQMPEGYLIVPGPHQGPPTATSLAFAEHAAATGSLPAPLVGAVRDEWRRWDVRTVIVGPGRYDQRAVAAEVARIVGRPPRWTGGVAAFADLSWN
jgi:hypothetical protein